MVTNSGFKGILNLEKMAYKFISISIASLLLFVSDIFAQGWRFPDCRDLEITNMQYNSIAADTLFVTVKNNCDTCNQHVYTGLSAYLNEDIVALEDIIYSKPSPENNAEYIYTLLTNQPFELSTKLRFEMVAGLCDTIIYSENLTIKIPPHIIIQPDRITINPNFICKELHIEGDFANYDITIYDELNNSIADFTEADSPLKINTLSFDDLIYFLCIQHQDLEDVRLQTIIKSCNNETTASEP